MASGRQINQRRVFLRRALFASSAGVTGLVWPSLLLAAGRVQLHGLRTSVDGEITRLVFDLDGPVEHALFTLSNPDRVVIDMRGVRFTGELPQAELSGSPLRGLRHAVRNDNDFRVVLDLARPANPRSFLLRPTDDARHRLVIDLQQEGAVASAAPASPASQTRSSEPARNPDVIVAIDAGHGGRDPGAIGPAGTFEKDIVLSIARRLERLVAAEPGMQPLMIRTGDYFLPLRERIERARAGHADVFVSIHADAAPNASASGSSVFILSERGASSEAARFLARRENEADSRLGLVTSDKDDVLTSVLLDLSQTGTLESSNTLADSLIGELHRVGKVRSPRVERAGFAVLRSPDVPSVLVEAAFISNPQEERKLRTTRFQESLAEALLGGLRQYFANHAPPNTLLAERRNGNGGTQHVIRRGETLSGIASQYQLSVNQLRRHNGLRSDVIRVGQVLEIPGRGS